MSFNSLLYHKPSSPEPTEEMTTIWGYDKTRQNWTGAGLIAPVGAQGLAPLLIFSTYILEQGRFVPRKAVAYSPYQ